MEIKPGKDISIEAMITSAAALPGVKVNRRSFLADIFKNNDSLLPDILEKGPAAAGISREELNAKAEKLIKLRTGVSTAASFAAGLPGGLAMAAALPADILQFFGMSVRIAQELSYLYGAEDLWEDGELDEEMIKNRLILYLGAMYAVQSARAGVRLLCAMNDKSEFVLPDSNRMLRLWMPLMRQIAVITELKAARAMLTRGISKAVPIAGGIISGGLNYASMLPMAKRLLEDLDRATFDYSQEELDKDIISLEKIGDEREASIYNTVRQQTENYINFISEKLKEKRNERK